MSESKLSRRSVISTLSATAAIAASSVMSASTKPPSKHLDLDTPEGNLDGYLKVRSSIDGETSVIWAEATVWSAFPDTPSRKAMKLFKLQGVNLTRCIKDATGYTYLQRESTYFCDLETGLPVDTWFNPYTDRKVKVFHIQNESVSSHYDLHGKNGPYHTPYIENSGDVTFYTDLFYSAPSPLNVEQYSPYAASDTYNGAGLYTWHAKRADIDNSDIATTPTVLSHVAIRQWAPWMEMGAWAGGLVIPSRGKKLMKGVSQLPNHLLKWMEKNAPIYLEAPPVSQKAQRNTFYGEFKKYVDEQRKERRK